MGKEIFIGVASCLALASGLIFYGMQKNDDDYCEDDTIPQDDAKENDEEEKVVTKKRQYNRRSTSKNMNRSKSSTKRNTYK